MSPSLGTENVPAPAVPPASGYSTTNVQVTGVDESDTVKTDSQYVYVISTIHSPIHMWGFNSQTSNDVYILKTDLQNPQVIGKIHLSNDTEPAGLYLSHDGTKLVVIASK